VPKRWPTKQRFWVYQYLAARDGECCLLCRKKPTTRHRLEIDHLDNVALNDNPANLHLLCSRCNKRLETLPVAVKKKMLLQAVEVCLCERDNRGTFITKNQVDYVKGSPEMQANDLFELDFRAWVLDKIRQYSSYPKDEAINSGAEVVGCSPLTAARYIKKLLSAEGVLQETKNPLKQMILTFKYGQGN